MKRNNDEMKSNNDEVKSNNDEVKSNNDEVKRNSDEVKSNNDEVKRNSDEMKSNSDDEKKMKKKGKSSATVTASEFKRKAESLSKQIYELSTLCNVPACLIIRTPETETYRKCSRTYTWPESGDEVRRVVDLYDSKVRDAKRSKIGGRSECLERVSFDDRFKGLTKAQGEKLVSVLDEKIKALRGKIEAAQASIGGGYRKIDSCDQTRFAGEGFKRFLVDERLKKLTAAQVDNLFSELDQKIESLTTKIDNAKPRTVLRLGIPESSPEASTGSCEPPSASTG